MGALYASGFRFETFPKLRVLFGGPTVRIIVYGGGS